MTPPARIAAAIAVLDDILGGENCEAALTRWGRSNRYAGSGDRSAVRDLVYEGLRRKRSLAALGGGQGARAVMIGLLRASGGDPDLMFTGEGHAPPKIGPDETPRDPAVLEALDCPDWLAPWLKASLGDDFAAVMNAMQNRAPVYLRVNLGKTTVEQAVRHLRAEGIETRPDSDVPSALEVLENARKINTSQAYLAGMVELQDQSSQAAVNLLPLRDGSKVLDYCAGGGGKTLAMASQAKGQFFAHDGHPQRMKDLPERANRAGVRVTLLANPAQAAPYDLVLCDVPCSGSGSWRRDPQGKWALTQQKLNDLCQIQREILDRAAPLVQPEGALAYVTCSVLREENEDQVAAFLAAHPSWHCRTEKRFALCDRGDGFFAAVLERKAPGGGA